MKRNLTILSSICLSLLLITGCASYRASALNVLNSEIISSPYSIKQGGIKIMAKAFDRVDCKRYLDRNVLKEGYQPIQLYIQNDSDKAYAFSLSRIDLPVARPEEVSKTVHTSTVGRVLAYGIPAFFLLWPLAIPATIDGIKSAKANNSLDADFLSKAARDQTIHSMSYLNKLIFVPLNDYRNTLTLVLIDAETNELKKFNVSIQ